MPLCVKHKLVEDFETIKEFWAKYGEDLQPEAEKFKQKPEVIEQPDYLLYVSQREYATIDLCKGPVTRIGSDEATTCHIIVLHCPGTGKVSLAHIDGSKVGVGVKFMVEEMKKQCKDFSHSLDLYMAGGFIDERGISHDNTMKLLREFMKQDCQIELQLACVSEMNDVVREGNHWPVVSGVGVKMDGNSFHIYRATFPEKVPDITLRGARLTVDMMMRRVYDTETDRLIVGPYNFYEHMLKTDDDSRDLTDGEIRRGFSTSPLVERPEFVQMIKDHYKYLADHLKLQITPSLPIGYVMNHGKWIPCTN
ncbi:protein N-terminal asparagine amidohydrolase-like isoform X2 [Lepisosteus oculatus]|uniref:Protein N-terminal asparagine amidohydrolase-like n=1 Tax=Lepisosteus oculatus TaxID=7918 RepID=W5M5X1_LEPOC|nr:PREDICTED: protein N-terminal asparagine amidohydrolase-like isoform X2 [Lepisosteus oculatus]